MIDFNLAEGLPGYEFADVTVWSDDRLRGVAAGLFQFLKRHTPAQTAPEEILWDADQALENIVFELQQRDCERAVAA